MIKKGKPGTQAEINRDKVKAVRERQLQKKEMQIEGMSNEEIIQELKAKGVPTYGTAAERKERLKKFHGVASADPTTPTP